jgi:hypothetical protein
MADDPPYQTKHPLWRLFAAVTLMVIILPATLWGIVQIYEIICAWCGCCSAMDRPRTR